VLGFPLIAHRPSCSDQSAERSREGEGRVELLVKRSFVQCSSQETISYRILKSYTKTEGES